MIAGDCGETDEFGKSFYAFARSYASQNEKDFEVFKAAIKSGRLKAASKKVAS
jgi:hypothetical protein